MNTVTSKDGTQIAYDKQGEGPAVILVFGALCGRSAAIVDGQTHNVNPEVLAPLLVESFAKSMS